MNSRFFSKLLIILIVVPCFAFATTDVIDTISGAFKTGNVSEISKYFDSNVELTILDQESTYSKSQAAVVVQNFFNSNPVKGFELVHRSASGDGSYGIGNLITASQTFRTYFYVKQKDGNSVIQELRFEKQ